VDKDLYDIKKIVYNLESGYFNGREVELLDNLILLAQKMKDKYVALEESICSNDNIELEKISTETFLYKPITVKNYYEGDYLERFGELRTSDLQSCKLLEKHNQFWKAYEVHKEYHLLGDALHDSYVLVSDESSLLKVLFQA